MFSRCPCISLETHLSPNWKTAHLPLLSFLGSDFAMKDPGSLPPKTTRMMICPSRPHPQRKIQFKMESTKEPPASGIENPSPVNISFSNYSFALRPGAPAPASRRTRGGSCAGAGREVRVTQRGSDPAQGSACGGGAHGGHAASPAGLTRALPRLNAGISRTIFLSKRNSGSQGRKKHFSRTAPPARRRN